MTTLHTEAAWPRPDDLTDEQLETLGADLPGYPVAIDSGLLIYVRYDVEAGDMAVALDQALALARQAHGRAFGEPADPMQLTLAPADQGLIPGPMDLVGTTDVAAMLGVSRQRAAQLVDRLPLPVGHPSGAPAWARRAVQEVTATWDRRPGRRPADTT